MPVARHIFPFNPSKNSWPGSFPIQTTPYSYFNMTSTPPAYATESSPPSYEEVVKKLDSLVGADPTPEKVLDVAKKLSKQDLSTLVENHDSHPPLKTDKEKYDFSIGSAKTASSDEASKYIQPAASSASRAAKEINATFQQLQLKIVQIDSIHQSGFSKPLQDIQTVALLYLSFAFRF